MNENLIKKILSRRPFPDSRTENAFTNVDRQLFLRQYDSDLAELDRPVSIGWNQTISQPSTVLDMVEGLQLKIGDKVLEVGAGSGYASAIISQLVDKVVAVEIIPDLADIANVNLISAGVNNVAVVVSDGGYGWIREAPYDKILVSAACEHIPMALVEQLVDGGIIVVPVGDLRSQQIIKGIKVNGSLKTTILGDYIFVPLTGEFGF